MAKKFIPVPRLLLTAAVAGALAGALAVYVSVTLSGNTPEPGQAPAQQAAASNDEADIAACAAKIERAKALGSAATGEVAALLPADPPVSLKTLAFNDPEGKPMTLADRAGKILLVNLWATWCAPCREEMPALNALEEEKGSEKFEVVAVNIDTGDDTKPKKFLADTNVDKLAYYRDSSLGLFNDLKKRGLALGLPVTLLVDDEGCLLGHMNGPAEWSSPDAKRLIDAALTN